MNGRKLKIVGMVVAGVCLLRVLAVAAASRDEVEVYSSTEDASESHDEEDERRAEIRISRPDEAASRVLDDSGHQMVRGAERLAASGNAIAVPSKNGNVVSDSELIVPKRMTAGRAIASVAESPMEVRNSASRSLASDVIDPPKPFTSQDAKERAAERSSDTIVASNNPLQEGRYGLKSEPKVETRVGSPVPSLSNRAGTQEISVIVSDYGYFPNRIFVTQNVPVKLYLTTPSKNTLCFMADTWGLKKGITPGRVEEMSFTPETPGDYRFYCPVKSIEGRITVKEAPVAETSTRGLATAQAAIEEEAPTPHNTPKNAAKLRSIIEE